LDDGGVVRPIPVTLGDIAIVAQADDGVGPTDGGAILRGHMIAVEYPGAARRFYRHGWQSWSQTRWLDLDEPAWTVPVAELWPLDDDPAYAETRCHGGESEVFDRYAAHLGDRLGRRRTRDLRVWCSWYSLYRTITEPALHAVVDELDGLALGPSRLAAP
jgi:hypothetical protein